MFTLEKDNIGEYVGSLIKKKGFSDRKFAIRCLELRYGKADSDAIQNMQNRICQIKKGHKWIQVEDLPVFSELLGVSIEEILSAGNSFIPDASRMTNYSVAFSKDPIVWREYIDNEDGIFLNYDEYGKSIIDYALQFRNYPLLKYLMDEEIIWFVGDEQDKYSYRFGAGTSVKRRSSADNFTWEYDIQVKDNLRTDMAALALENHDYDLLDDLHARETPDLYYSRGVTLGNEGDFINNRLIDVVANADKMSLVYFTESFSVGNESAPNNLYIFPYVNELVNALVKKRSPYVKEVLKRIERHNEEVLRVLSGMISKEKNIIQSGYGAGCDDETLKSFATRFFFVSDRKDMVRYTGYESKESFGAFIVKLTVNSNNTELQQNVEKINSTYEQIIAMEGR